MADVPMFALELTWGLMTPMESTLWGTTLALHMKDPDIPSNIG